MCVHVPPRRRLLDAGRAGWAGWQSTCRRACVHAHVCRSTVPHPPLPACAASAPQVAARNVENATKEEEQVLQQLKRATEVSADAMQCASQLQGMLTPWL